MAKFIRPVDEQEVLQREQAADRALYAVDPDFARSLGYVAPRTRAGSRQQPTSHAVRSLPNVLAQTLTRQPLDAFVRAGGSPRMISTPFSALTLRSGFLGA